MRFRGKNGFYFLSQLERFWKKAKLRPEKRFEANALEFFKIKILRICREDPKI